MATRSVILKRSAVGAAILIFLLVILIALLPMLISAGLGHGMVRSAIEGNLATGSRAEFQTLSVTWRGPQEIHRLRIVDPQGEEVADVNVTISPGLWGLLFGTFGVLEANVSGALPNVEIYDDGTTNIQRVLAEREPDPAKRPMEGVPPLILRLDAMDAVVAHVGAAAVRHEMTVRDLSGFLSYSPAKATDPSEVSFEFAARTSADDVQGEMRFAGRSRNLFDADGAFTPEGAPLNVSLDASNLPALGMDVPTILTRLALAVTAENLGQLVSATVESEATIQDEPPSRFRAEINVRVPFRPDGTLDMTLENIAATASGERVPSSLLQPMLAATPIVLSRDVGRSIDLDAQVSPAKGTAVIRAAGPRASLEMSAAHDADTGWWRGDRLVLITPQAHPDLVHGFTNLTVDRPVNLEINMTQFSFPPIDPATETRPLRQYGGTGVLRVSEPVAISFGTQAGAQPSDAPGQPQQQTILVEQAELQFDSPSLGDYLDLAGTLRADGGVVQITQRITNLFDAAGAMDVMTANFVGEVNVEGLPAATVAQWIPDQEETIRELLGEQVNATLTTTLEEAGLRGVLVARGAQAQADVELLRRPDALEILRTSAEFTLTPALVQRWQEPDEEQPIALLEPARVQVEIDPVTIPGARPGEYRLEQTNFGGRLVADNLAVSGLPGIPEAVSVHDVVANLAATLSRDPFAPAPAAPGEELPEAGLLASYSLEGRAGVRHYGERVAMANLAYNVTGRPGATAQQQTQLDGTIALTEVNVAGIERAIGREPGDFAMWLGETGAINAQFSAVGQRYQATLVSEMPRLQGSFAANYADEVLALNTDNASLLLGAPAMAQLLGGEEARIVVERDVPFTFALRSRLPLGFLMQEAFAAELLDVRAEMHGGPIVMRVGDERQTLEDVDMTITADANQEALEFRLVLEGLTAESAAAAPGRQPVGQAPPPGAIGAPPDRQPDRQPDQRQAQAPQQRGSLSVDATLREPVTPGRPLTFEQTRMDLDATFDRAPTAIADALLQMNGRLTALVGTTFGGTIVARDLARGPLADGGTLDVNLESPNGFLRGSGVARGGAVHFTEAGAIEAQLDMTPLMRDLILTRIHPIFADLFLADERLSARFAPASIPLDGDVRKLDGDAQLIIGTIMVDRRSPMFALLAIPRLAGIVERPDTPSAAIAATIDPISVRVRGGVIDYQRFLMHINETAMPFTGSINLVTGSVNVRTAMPLGLLQIPELDRILPRGAETLEVPLVARGTIGDPIRLEIDPDFDLAGQLIRMGLERGILDRLRPRNGEGDPSDILRDILRPRPRNSEPRNSEPRNSARNSEPRN